MKNRTEYLTCVNCGEKTLEEHGTEPGEHHWFFCRSCGAVIEPFQMDEREAKDEYTKQEDEK